MSEQTVQLTGKANVETRDIADACAVTIQTVNNWIRRGWVIETDTGRTGKQQRYVPVSELKRIRRNLERGLPVYAGVRGRNGNPC